MMSADFFAFQARDVVNFLILIATIVAIYLGPIRAVQITKRFEQEREKRAREYAILRDLMKTRRIVLDPLHVATLNMVELEFSDSHEIKDKYRRYMENLFERKLKEDTAPDEVERLTTSRSNLLFDLIHAIGGRLGYSFDKQDLKNFSYAPQGWHDLEAEQQSFRRLMIALLEGKRGLPVTQFVPSRDDSKFPPPPAV